MGPVFVGSQRIGDLSQYNKRKITPVYSNYFNTGTRKVILSLT